MKLREKATKKEKEDRAKKTRKKRRRCPGVLIITVKFERHSIWGKKKKKELWGRENGI